MTNKELKDELLKASMDMDKLDCIGCGYEHGCVANGCAILKTAAARIRTGPWISVKERLPDDPEESVLAVVSGKPCQDLRLELVPEVAIYFGESEGWYIKRWPQWDDPKVDYWMPIPDIPGIPEAEL
jgi:hypothetical protein